MKNKTVKVKFGRKSGNYQIDIGHGSLKNSGSWAKRRLSTEAGRIAIVSNSKIFRLYGEAITESLENAGFEVLIWLMKDGEKHKSFRSLENVLKFFSEKKLSRTDGIIALGGGVVGDLAGFAASIYLRGVAFLQIPTTLLAMIDSSVGGKTAVNTEYGKNLIGTFYQPKGVLIDIETLQTLPRRELTAGFCEAVKQGAIASRQLFKQTGDFLREFSPEQFKTYYSNNNFLSKLENLLAAQVSFKAEIVMQDEQEDTSRTDAKSRKILNFGHTLAHSLEKITDYKYFKHGEAVGYGILFAAELSKNIEILDDNELNLLNDVLHRAGRLPDTKNISLERVIEAFLFDKKIIGKSLQWILLEGIGQPKIIQNQEIPRTAIQNTLKKILK